MKKKIKALCNMSFINDDRGDNVIFFCYNPDWTRGAALVDYAKWLPNKKLLHESTHSYLPNDDSKKKCPKNKTYWNIGAKVTGYIKGTY